MTIKSLYYVDPFLLIHNLIGKIEGSQTRNEIFESYGYVPTSVLNIILSYCILGGLSAGGVFLTRIILA